jgi:hypothetical protein
VVKKKKEIPDKDVSEIFSFVVIVIGSILLCLSSDLIERRQKE